MYSAHRGQSIKTYSKNLDLMVGSCVDGVHDVLNTDIYQVTDVDLTKIDGLAALGVQKIITETGADMSQWPAVKHFTPWLTLAPHNDISGGKILKGRTLKSKN